MESVLLQDWAEVEYLVVDPGSTDDTAEIIRSFQSRYPGRIIHLTERDKGPADGLNRAFARATGDLFGYLNADDYYVPGCFRRAASAAQRFPNAAVVYGDGFTVDGDGRLLKRVVSTTFSAKRFVYGGSLVLQQSSFYRSDAFRAIGGFKTENRTSWDAELLLDMSLRDMTLVHVPEYWSAFRIHSESITGSQRLAEESRKTHARYFRAVMGREKKSLDKLAAKFVFAYTLLTEPRGLLTRVSDRLRSVISNPKTKKLGQKHLAYRG